WGTASGITVTSDLTNAIGYNVEEMPLAVIASTVNITVGDVSTSIDPSELEGYAFLQNVPNPFHESTTFTFSLPTQEDVKIEIYNALGQLVRSFEGSYGLGVHELQWNGANGAGQEVADGIYSVRLRAGAFQSAINVKKMR
ncbi:MAG: T9SS type A sorting domain-containing protein, partial [Bacteroidia bacterium]|nr:T9SS type A sorting domain-containing protein [Bacteroidia bacterium]